MFNKLLNHWVVVLGILCSAIPFFFDSLTMEHKLIIILGANCLTLSISYIKNEADKYKMIKNYNDLENRHKALSALFKRRSSIIQKYQEAVFVTINILHVALANTKEAKLTEITNSISNLFNNIKDGD